MTFRWSSRPSHTLKYNNVKAFKRTDFSSVLSVLVQFIFPFRTQRPLAKFIKLAHRLIRLVHFMGNAFMLVTTAVCIPMNNNSLIVYSKGCRTNFSETVHNQLCLLHLTMRPFYLVLLLKKNFSSLTIISNFRILIKSIK